MSRVVAALDIGGTKTAGALVGPDGTLLERGEVPTPGSQGADAVLTSAVGLVRSLLSRCPGVSPVAVGVGSAGVVDPVTGVVIGATDVLAGWAGAEVHGRLSSALDLPVAVSNDVHAHALGEARHGAATGRRSVLLLAVGTGIGAGFVHADLPAGVLVGAHAAAGHAGHVPSTHAGDLPCSCGGRGHLEAIAAGPALAREYARRTGDPDVDLRTIGSRATNGDGEAAAVVGLGGTAVGAAIGGLVNVLDPDVVVVGGGVAQLGDSWWAPLRDEASRQVLPALRATPVVPSALGPDAALVGAAHLAWTTQVPTEERVL